MLRDLICLCHHPSIGENELFQELFFSSSGGFSWIAFGGRDVSSMTLSQIFLKIHGSRYWAGFASGIRPRR